jgi:uncharacterized protein YjiS (DUF1127 family)
MTQRMTAQELDGQRFHHDSNAQEYGPQRFARSATSEDDLAGFRVTQTLGAVPVAWSRPSIGGVFRLPLQWLKRIRHRQAIASLTDAQLFDVGLSRDFVARESAKHFWQE